MIKIGICDDNREEINVAEDCISEYFLRNPRYDYSVDAFFNPMNLVPFIEENGGFDILFLDVYMPQMTGTELAKILRDKGVRSKIVFLTTSRDHAIDAFAVRASGYLLKPFSQESFMELLDEIMPQIEKESARSFAMRTSQGGVVGIPFYEIAYIELQNRRLYVHTEDEKVYESTTIRRAFEEEMSEFINAPEFVQCQKSYLVNFHYVNVFENGHFIMRDGTEVPVAKRLAASVRQKYMDFLLR